VAALDHHVDRGDDAAIRRRDDGGVVARADGDIRCLRQPCGYSGYEAELAKIGNGDDSVACPSGTVWLSLAWPP
jgi:nitrite reductase/ring-hydroxylating ferredoxin subunit